MACRTFPGAVKISLPGLRVPRLQVGNINAASKAVFGPGYLSVNESDQPLQLLIGKIEARHPLCRTAIPHYIPDRASINVVCHQFGLRQVRTCFSSLRIASVAEGTVLLK